MYLHTHKHIFACGFRGFTGLLKHGGSIPLGLENSAVTQVSLTLSEGGLSDPVTHHILPPPQVGFQSGAMALCFPPSGNKIAVTGELQ